MTTSWFGVMMGKFSAMIRGESVVVTSPGEKIQAQKTNTSIHYTDCPPKKLQSAFGYRLRKNPLWNLKNQTGL